MELVTGKGATDHVSSADMASLYRGILIADDVVLDSGDNLSCTMLDANTAEIGTGDCLLQGHHARVDVAEQLAIKSGSVGFNSNDLIIVRYSLGDGNIQAAQLVVLEGEAVAGEPDDPTLVSGDIDGGSTVVEFALWRIPKRGITVNTPERIMPTVDTLQGQIDSVRESVSPDGPHTLADGATYSKIGRLCILMFSSYSSQGGGIGTLPAGYRPVDYIAVPVYCIGTSGYVDVSPGGVVSTSAVGAVFGEVVYIVQAS